MKLIILLMLMVSQAQAATVPAKTCNLSDVRSAIADASPGDIVSIPAGTCQWTSELVINKGITITGAGAGQTIILDAVTSGPLLLWTGIVNGVHRLSGLEFRNGGRNADEANGILRFVMTNLGTTTLRIDHNKFDRLAGVNLRLDTAIGVADHNVFLESAHHWPFQFNDPDWNGKPGTSSFGDVSWNTPIHWGSSEFFFVEDNTVTFDLVANNACTDAYRGARFVMRYNTLTNCDVENHGTESVGRPRGALAMEVYKNQFSKPGVNRMVFMRSGSALIWGNTGIGVNDTPHAAVLADDRINNNFLPFGGADGASPWDVNGPEAYRGVATGGSLTSVTVAGTPWTAGVWVGFVIRKINCTPTLSSGNNYNRCHAVIMSNDTGSLVFAVADFPQKAPMTFSAGDTFVITQVKATLDQPGRSGGALIGGNAPNLPREWNSQPAEPVYSWLNTNDGKPVYIGMQVTDCPATVCRDSFLEVTTALVAHRPVSCTGLSAFWATDESRAYKCSAGTGETAGRWAAFYEPYVYPHPLAVKP